jgi:hypothetical protein
MACERAVDPPDAALVRGEGMSEVGDTPLEDTPNGDWVSLVHSLVERFPQIAAGEVLQNLTRNRQAAEAFGLAEAEHLPTVAVMTHYQMMQLSGEVPDNARYKPEGHVGRNQSADHDGVETESS